MRVYIAGALSSKEKNGRNPSEVVVDYLRNVHSMIAAASAVRHKGYFPYVPALDMLLGVGAGDWTEDDYRGIGLEFLEVCDAVLVISLSWGVLQELARAEALGIPVYRSLEELYEAVG